MTVSTKQNQPVLGSLLSLLQPDLEPTAGGDGELSKATAVFGDKVSTAIRLLATAPSLHSLALEVVGNALVFLLKHTLPQGSQEEDAIKSQLAVVWLFLEDTLAHSPQSWSAILFKWCVRVLGQLSQTQGSPTAVEDSLQKWLGLPLIAPVLTFLYRSTTILVESGQVGFCMSALLPLVSTHSYSVSWLVAHIVSQYPAEMMGLLLEHILSFPQLPTHAPSHPPAFTMLTHTLCFLSRSHSEHLEEATIRAVCKFLDSPDNEGTAASIRMILVVASQCPAVTKVIAKECLKYITPVKLCKLLTKSRTTQKASHENHVTSNEETDEGEILSDEEMDTSTQRQASTLRLEEVVGLVCELWKQLRGAEAVRALNCVMDIYSHTITMLKNEEAGVEEGEIVHESPLEWVIEACRRIMSNCLSRLHSTSSLTHLSPSQRGAGPDLDLVVSVECGLTEWADRLLDHHGNESKEPHICVVWLHEILSCVCVCTSELVAGQLLSHLLLHATTAQLSQVLEIYWEVHIRHPHVAESAIQSSISTVHRLAQTVCSSERDPLACFIRNMLSLLDCKEFATNKTSSTQLSFSMALFDHTLSLAELLPLSISSPPQLLLIFKLLRCNLIGRSHQLSVHNKCKLTQILLNTFLSIMTTSSLVKEERLDVAAEVCLGKCRDLIGWCCSESNPAVVTLAHSRIIATISSKERNTLFLRQQLTSSAGTVSSRSSLLHSDLLSNGIARFSLRLSANSQTNGTEKEGVGDVASVSNASHMIQLLLATTSHNSSPSVSRVEGLANIFMEQVAPLSDVELTQWPDEDSLKHCLEYDLKVKRRFDENPFLWYILLMISEQNGRPCPLLVCASLIRSLLTMLSQHWQRCRLDDVSLFQWELECSVILIEILAKACWLKPPLSFINELFSLVSCKEVHLLLTTVNSFIKENFKLILNGTLEHCEDEGKYNNVVKATIVSNIGTLGHFYPRFMSYTHTPKL